MTKRGEIVQSQVIAVLRASGKPMTAYDLLDELKADTPKMAPPTVYRALAALKERGAVHRLESLNAYMACACGDHAAPSILSICDACGIVEERLAPDLIDALSSAAGQSGFDTTRHVVELHGQCAQCTLCGTGGQA